VEFNLSESDGGEKKGVSARFTLKEKKTYMGVRKRLKNRKKGNISSSYMNCATFCIN